MVGAEQTLTPYLTVSDADGFLDFAHKVFDAETIKEDRYEDGTVQHARLRIGQSVLMLNQSTATYPPHSAQLHAKVADVEKAHDCALRLGAEDLMAPNLRPHGEMMAGFRDPYGNVWWVAR